MRIDKNNVLCREEIYTSFWQCKNSKCLYEWVQDNFNFCPKCGKKIEWIGDFPKNIICFYDG